MSLPSAGDSASLSKTASASTDLSLDTPHALERCRSFSKFSLAERFALDPRHAFELFNERMVRCRLAAQHALVALDDTTVVRRHFVHQFSHQPRLADPCIPFDANHLSVALTR